MPHILFDAFELAPGYGKSLGIYRYSRNLFKYMAQNIPQGFTVSLVCNSINYDDFCADIPDDKNLQIHCVPIAKMSRKVKLSWELFRASHWIKKLNADAYFNPKGFAPGLFTRPKSCKIILTVHDLIPFWYQKNVPSYRGRLERSYVCAALRRSIQWSDLVIAISNGTAKDVQELVPSTRIRVVYNGIESLPTTPQGSSLDIQPFFFSVASSLPHKNLSNLLAGYSLYHNAHKAPIPLIVCGIRDPGQTDVHGVYGISDEELSKYYHDCKAFLFLSQIEGFGFPPMEALMQGASAVVSDIPVHREILGDSVTYVPPLEPSQIAEAFSRIHKNPRPIMSASLASVWKDRFAWRDCATATWKHIEQLF